MCGDLDHGVHTAVADRDEEEKERREEESRWRGEGDPEGDDVTCPCHGGRLGLAIGC